MNDNNIQMTIQQLFFELIQVALGVRVCLSHSPTAEEWKALYDIAKKQSLVGICFAGVQKLVDSEKEDYCGMSEMLYLTWMGMAAKIQQRNEVVNRQCVELQAKLAAAGYDSCILKGQGVGALYRVHDNNDDTLRYDDLSMLRQSGDIDILIPGGAKAAKKLIATMEQESVLDYVHGDLDIFEDTEVELHHRPGCLQNLWANWKYQRWARKNAFEGVRVLPLADGEITVPSAEFNCVFLLTHMYKHVFSEGLGLRQVMDYYMVLRTVQEVQRVQGVQRAVKDLGLNRFASGVMWIMQEVFGLSEQQMLCKPNERVGRFLLDDIMSVGNFGHYDEEHKGVGDSLSKRMITHILQRNWHYMRVFPVDVLWTPLWMAYQSVYRKVIVKRL